MLKDNIRVFLLKEMVNNDVMQVFKSNEMPYQEMMSY